MMRAAFQKSLSLLVVLFLTIMAGWHNGLSLTRQDSPVSRASCRCCNADGSNCATPACCARQENRHTPVTPAAPRPASGYDSHPITSPSLALFTLPLSTLHALPITPPPVQAG